MVRSVQSCMGQTMMKNAEYLGSKLPLSPDLSLQPYFQIRLYTKYLLQVNPLPVEKKKYMKIVTKKKTV